MKINTKFDVNQKVFLKELKIFGRVLSIFVNSAKEISYNIRYFDGVSPKELYFLEDEMSLQEDEKKVGF